MKTLLLFQATAQSVPNRAECWSYFLFHPTTTTTAKIAQTTSTLRNKWKHQLPSGRMFACRHFANRHAWHWFRRDTSTMHFPPSLHVYSRFLLKKVKWYMCSNNEQQKPLNEIQCYNRMIHGNCLANGILWHKYKPSDAPFEKAATTIAWRYTIMLSTGTITAYFTLAVNAM